MADMNAIVRGNVASRTSWAAAVLILLGILQQALPQFVDVIPDEYEGITLSLVGAVFVWLRNLTKQSIADKGARP